MSKTSILSLLFLFSLIIGGLLYLNVTHFWEINGCLSTGNSWNYEESVCKTGADIEYCRQQKGQWISEESTCDYGFIIK